MYAVSIHTIGCAVDRPLLAASMSARRRAAYSPGARRLRRWRHRFTLVLIALGFGLLIGGALLMRSLPPPAVEEALVVRVVDGDTIVVRRSGVDARVRYLLINAPEVDQPLAADATAVNRALVEGKRVRLVRDMSETDRYDRLLRYVYLADGTFVNAEIVRRGYAALLIIPPDTAKASEIRAAQAEAIAAGIGLWAGEGSESFLPETPLMRAGD